MSNRSRLCPPAIITIVLLFVAFVGGDSPASASGAAVAIDPGGAHTCALTSDGELRCWGWNFHGQLGDNTVESLLEPAAVELPNVAAFALGGNHTCAVSEGDVLCWGLNDSGQLGDGTTETKLAPVDVCASGPADCKVSHVTLMAAGSSHTCAIDGIVTRTVVCWGENSGGQLGNGDTENSTRPVHACASLPCQPLSDISSLAAGSAHTCALSAFEGVLCWGSNVFGQLGDGGQCGTVCSLPVSVCIAVPPSACASPNDLISLSAGGRHTCVVTSERRAFCWGDNDHGQLGTGSELSSSVPLEVCTPGSTACPPGSALESPVAIAGGLSHTCALSTSGDVSCWGLNFVGQLGNGSGGSSSLPVAVDGLAADVVEIAAGSAHACARGASGALQCWGWNADGRLGDGSFSGRDGPVDVIGFGGKPATPTPTPAPTAPPLAGDADCDGVVDAIDATLVLQHSAALIPALPCATLADADANGAVDSRDASLILQFVAGLISTLPP